MWIKVYADMLVDTDKIAGFTYSKDENVTYGVMTDASKIRISNGNIIDCIIDNLLWGTTVMEVR